MKNYFSFSKLKELLVRKQMSFKTDSWRVNNALIEEQNILGNIAVNYSGAKTLMEEGAPEWIRRTLKKLEAEITGSFHEWNVSYQNDGKILQARFETTYNFEESQIFRSIPLDTANSYFLPCSTREPLEVEVIANYEMKEEEFQNLFH